MDWKRALGLALSAVALALVVWGLFSAKISIDVAPPQPVSVEDLIPTIIHTQNVNVAEDGGLSIGGTPTRLDNLARDLEATFAKVGAPADKASQPVIIRASPNTPRRQVDSVRRVLTAGGWTKVSLSMSASR